MKRKPSPSRPSKDYEIKEIARLLKRARALLKLKGSPRTRSRFFTGPPYGEFSRDFASWGEEENEAAHAAAHVAEKTARAMAPMAAVGQKVVEGAKRGGRKNPNRDLEMWQEFERRRPNSHKTDSALAEDIGRAHGLRRSGAIDAVGRGKKLSGLGRTGRR